MTDDQHVRWIIEQLGTDEHGQLPGNWTMEVDFILPLLDKARCETARAIHSEIAELTFGSGVDVDGAVNVILSIIAGDFGLEDGDGSDT